MNEEIKAIEKNYVLELTSLSQGKKTIGVKQAFKEKRNAKREVERYKARLAMDGYK